MQEKLFYTIKNTGGRYPDTMIDFEENECDYEFTAEENKILDNAAYKFNDHMEEVLNRIEESLDYQLSDECISEELQANLYEYTADGKRYL